MPRANHDHRVEDVRFRDRHIRCTCGWESRDTPVDEAWLIHRRAYGLTSK